MTSEVVFKQCIAWPRNPPPRGGLLRGFVTSIGDKTGVLAGVKFAVVARVHSDVINRLVMSATSH